MWILLIVKIAIFLSNAAFTFMKYSKIPEIRNLDTTWTSTWGRNCIRDFCHGSTQCRMCLLRIRKPIFANINEVSVKKMF